MIVENHPNGFTKVIVGSLFGYRIRIHYWPKAANKSESRHNHRWWFVSIPLLGRFVDNRYAEVGSGGTMRIKVFDQDGQRDSRRVYTLDGTSGLRLRHTYLRYPLIPYFCPRSEIHSYYPHGDGRHISLVIISPVQVEFSEIWREPGELDVDLES